MAYLQWSVRQTETFSVTFLPLRVWKPGPYPALWRRQLRSCNEVGYKHEVFVFLPVTDFWSVQLNSHSPPFSIFGRFHSSLLSFGDKNFSPLWFKVSISEPQTQFNSNLLPRPNHGFELRLGRSIQIWCKSDRKEKRPRRLMGMLMIATPYITDTKKFQGFWQTGILSISSRGQLGAYGSFGVCLPALSSLPLSDTILDWPPLPPILPPRWVTQARPVLVSHLAGHMDLHPSWNNPSPSLGVLCWCLLGSKS